MELYLFIIVCLIALSIVAWFIYLAKKQGFESMRNQIRTIYIQNLNRHHQVLVLRYRNQEYLIGLSNNHMSVIDTFSVESIDNQSAEQSS